MNHIAILDTLCANGFHAFVVGGCVRDLFLGKDAKDIDIVTNARPDDISLMFSSITKVKEVGKSFGVMLVNDYEVATYRKDRYEGLNDKACEVTFADTIEEDLSRRDLTINAMAMCEYTGRIVDEHGGVEDLSNAIIRFVGNANERIFEDPNRIIRACRFLAKIDGDFEFDTFKALCKHSHLIKTHVAPERIRIEILKAMENKNASSFFAALHAIGALEYIFPSLASAWNHDHGVWHTETVFDHMMMVGDSISTKFPILKLAGYLHDVGKPMAFIRNIDVEKVNFGGHEKDSDVILTSELAVLNFPLKEIEKITGIARVHMYHVFEISPKAVRKLLSKLNERGVSIEEFLRIRLADHAGNLNNSPFSISEIRTMVKTLTDKSVTDIPFTTKALAISGGELIVKYSLKPCPLVGDTLKHLLKFVLENGPEYNLPLPLFEEAEKFLCGDKENE